MYAAVVQVLWYHVCADAIVVYFVGSPAGVLAEGPNPVALVVIVSHLCSHRQPSRTR
jgi:hypothetical protein